MKYILANEIQYEVDTIGPKLSKILVVNPLINYILPESFLRWVLRRSKSPLVRESIERPGGWRAVRLCYDYTNPTCLIDKISRQEAILPIALRNRKRMFTRRIAELIDKYAASGDVKILGVGAGPGINVIEGMAKAKAQTAFAYCVDMDEEAFQFGRHLAERFGVSDRVSFIKGDVREIEKHIDATPQIAKMIGIAEYFGDEEFLDLCRRLYDILAPGGSILVSSLSKSHGIDRFLRRILNWHIVYRNPEEIISLLEECGFKDFETEDEPMGICAAIAGHKGQRAESLHTS